MWKLADTQEKRGSLRPTTRCLHAPAGARGVLCASLFYLETILKQTLNDVQPPSINISADKRWVLSRTLPANVTLH